jgi:phosphoenolpyruvate synthase/pyruvate phosphate dikinase
VPMVTLVEEMAEVRKRFHAIADGAGFGKLPPLGAVIATPAAALTIGDIIQHTDFLSIGTKGTDETTTAKRQSGRRYRCKAARQGRVRPRGLDTLDLARISWLGLHHDPETLQLERHHFLWFAK